MSDKNTLLVTGAAGFVGSELLRALIGDDAPVEYDEIVATDINPLPPDLQDASKLVYRRTDIRERRAVVDLFKEFKPRQVVHLAAMVTPPKGASRQLQYEVDVDGTRNVITGCVAAKTEQFVYTSSGAAYGYHPDNPIPLSETDQLRGNKVFAYAHNKRRVEEDLAQARAEHPELKQLIFRVSTILGPTTDNQITGLFEQAVVPGIAGADSPFCIIADDDVIGAMVHGLQTEQAGIYNLTGDGILTLEEIANRMGGRYLPMPEGVVRGVLAGLSTLGASPYGPEQTLFIKHRPVLDNRRLVDEFGYRPQWTTDQAFERYRRARRPDNDDRVVLITGAGGGLGCRLARVHAEQGHRLALTDRDADGLERTYMMVRALGAEAIRIDADITDAGDCHRIVSETQRQFGGIDILYNNAGIPLRALFEETSADEVKKVLDVNFMGAVRMTEAALPSLRQRSGRIAAISSVAGFAPLTGRTAYAASKHALHGFFESLRTEVDGDGVSISLVCPGYLNTRFRKAAQDGAAEMDVDEAAYAIVEAVEERQPLVLIGRTAKFAWWVHRLAPTAFEKLMRRSVRDEFPT